MHPSARRRAVAVFQQGSIGGEVRFEDAGDGQHGTQNVGTVVSFALSGLPPLSQHAVHVHEYGDLSAGSESLGGHLNPRGERHGSICLDGPMGPRHAGDLINNLVSDERGQFFFAYIDPMLRVDCGPFGVIGRSVVIHAGVDDLGRGGTDQSLTTGNAGGRMACAVIGVAPSRQA